MFLPRYIFVTLLTVLTALLQPLHVVAASEATQESPARPAGTPAELLMNGGDSASLFLAIVKIIGALVVVLGLLLTLAWLFRKIGFNQRGGRQGSLINVLDSRMVAPKKYIAVIEIADEFVAVGITDQNISFLTRLENTAEITKNHKTAGLENQTGSKSFSTLLDKAKTSFSGKKTQDN